MNSKKILIASVFAVAAAMAAAQSPIKGSTKQVSKQDLLLLQQDLIAAVDNMSAALPIYHGHRANALHKSHHALEIMDRVLKSAKASKKAAAKGAKDTTAFKSAKKQYTAAQIAASLDSMKRGLAALQDASLGLNKMNANAGKRSAEVLKLVTQSITECNIAINYHK